MKPDSFVKPGYSSTPGQVRTCLWVWPGDTVCQWGCYAWRRIFKGMFASGCPVVLSCESLRTLCLDRNDSQDKTPRTFRQTQIQATKTQLPINTKWRKDSFKETVSHYGLQSQALWEKSSTCIQTSICCRLNSQNFKLQSTSPVRSCDSYRNKTDCSFGLRRPNLFDFNL